MSKKTFEVCVYMTVEADSLREANQKVEDFITEVIGAPTFLTTAQVQTSWELDNVGQRVYYAHPEKYSVEEWEDRCERGLDDSEDDEDKV